MGSPRDEVYVVPKKLNKEASDLLKQKTSDNKKKTIKEALIDGSISDQDLQTINRAIVGTPKVYPNDKVTNMIQLAATVGAEMSDEVLFNITDRLTKIECTGEERMQPYRTSASLAKCFLMYELDRHLQKSKDENKCPDVFLMHLKNHFLPNVKQRKEDADKQQTFFANTLGFVLLKGTDLGRFEGTTDRISAMYDANRALFTTVQAMEINLQKLPYRGYDSGTNTGFESVMGKKPSQEDTLAFGVLPNFASLDTAAQKRVLENFVTSMQTEVTNQLSGVKILDRDRSGQVTEESVADKQGSTLAATVIQGNSVHHIGVGDSRCMLVVWDKEGNVQQCERVNKNLHNANNKDEVNFLIEKAKEKGLTEADIGEGKGYPVVGGGRLGFQLQVTRSIGDNEFESVGLLHEGQHYFQAVTIPEGGKAVVLTMCDGATEQWKSETEESEMRKFLHKKHVMNPEQLSKAIIDHATTLGSKDNLTAMVMAVDSNNHQPRYNVVADGHGGEMVSHFIAQHTQQILELSIKQELKSRKQAEPVVYTSLSSNDILRHLIKNQTGMDIKADEFALSAKQAEQQLQGQPEGTFLVRKSISATDDDNITISYAHSGRVYHEKFSLVGDTYFTNIMSLENQMTLKEAVDDLTNKKFLTKHYEISYKGYEPEKLLAWLKDAIKQYHDIYTSGMITMRTKKVDKIVSDCNAVYTDASKSPADKIEAITQLVWAAYQKRDSDKQEESGAKTYKTGLFSKTTANSLEEFLNVDMKHHESTRNLGLILKSLHGIDSQLIADVCGNNHFVTLKNPDSSAFPPSVAPVVGVGPRLPEGYGLAGGHSSVFSSQSSSSRSSEATSQSSTPSVSPNPSPRNKS